MKVDKEFNFVVTVKKNGHHIFNVVSLFMLIIGGSLNLYIWFLAQINSWLTPLLIAIAILIFTYQHLRTKMQDFIPSYSWSLTFCGAAFILGPVNNLLLGTLYFIASFFERQIKHPLEFGFDQNGIFLNSIPSKNLLWSEVSNVILKDSILTVDLKSNRIIQKETEECVSKEIETEFNEFCRKYLSSNV